MDYGKVLEKAWHTIWKHKILWLFGILAGCGVGGGGGSPGGSGSGYQFSGNHGSSNKFMFTPNLEEMLKNIRIFFENIPAWGWAVILVAIGLLIFTFILIASISALFIGPLGTSGVIKGTILADEMDDEGHPLSLQLVFKALKPYYWRILLLRLLVMTAGLVLSLILVAFIVGPIILTLGLAIPFMIPFFFLIIPISLFVNLLIINSDIAVIDEDQSVFGAVVRAWQVITGNLGPMIVMLLILTIGQFILALFIALPFIIILLPGALSLLSNQVAIINIGVAISGLLLVFMIVIAIILNGVIKAYVLSAYTLTYRQLKTNVPLKIQPVKPDEDAVQDQSIALTDTIE